MQEKTFLRIYGLLLTPLAFIWLRSSIGKITEGTFAQNLNLTFAHFAEKNPFPFYQELLSTTAIPNYQILGTIVMWTEFVTAVILSFSALLLIIKPKKIKPVLATLSIGLFLGIIMNINFWFASGWTSPSTDGLNLLMTTIQAILLGIAIHFIRQK